MFPFNVGNHFGVISSLISPPVHSELWTLLKILLQCKEWSPMFLWRLVWLWHFSSIRHEYFKLKHETFFFNRAKTMRFSFFQQSKPWISDVGFFVSVCTTGYESLLKSKRVQGSWHDEVTLLLWWFCSWASDHWLVYPAGVFAKITLMSVKQNSYFCHSWKL